MHICPLSLFPSMVQKATCYYCYLLFGFEDGNIAPSVVT